MDGYGLLRGWALGVYFCALCAGQIQGTGGLQPFPQNASPGETRTLSGTVVNSATGEPIPHALVQVFGPQGAAAFTGADGHFEIPNVAKQPFGISAQKPGYTATGQNGRAAPVFAMGAPQIGQYGPNENSITLKLAPDAGIHGRLMSDQGQPVEGVQVRALAEQIIGGRKQEHFVSTAQTDENGEYDLDGLAPGTYFLQTQQRPLYRMPVALPAAQLAYPAEFYPDAPDRVSAQAVQLQPGQTAEADFTLRLVPTFRVTGGISGVGNGGIFVTMAGANGDEVWTPMQFNPRTGQFTLTAVPAGSWTFMFRANGGNGRADFAYAEAQLDVKSNLSNLRLALQPVFPIPVTIVHAPDSGNGGTRKSQPNVQLIPRVSSEGSPFFRQTYTASRFQPQQQAATPDTLEFRGVPPGKYQVAVRSVGSECLDTVASGSTDLTHNDLTVSEGAPPQPITVSLRDDCAGVSGTVQAQGTVVRPVYVLLVPDSGVGEPVTITTQPNVQFTFAGIRPDAYHAYAIPDLSGVEYKNPEALRGLNAQEITLAPNQKAAITLDLATGDSQ